MRYYSSTAQAATLTSDLPAGATSMTLSGTTGFPVSHPFTLVIDPGGNEEIVDVIASSGTTLTITRGRDGTTARDHLTGAQVRHMMTARDLREPQEHINATTNVHGASGTLVTTSATQTLTNKTLDGSQNTFVNIPASALLGDAGGSAPVGAVSAFAGSSAPDGWLMCNGAAVSRTTYDALFTVIGTTYGAGDGSTTFNLPNLVNRFPVGAGGSYAPGATGGADSVTLTTAQMPSHSHAASANATTFVIDKSQLGSSVSTGANGQLANGGGASVTSGVGGLGSHSHSVTVSNTGSGQAHENRPPYVALNYIIKT